MIFFAFGYLDTTVIQATEVYKNFTKDFAQVQRLWDDFDAAPLIRGYDTGGDFHFSNGNIEIKDLSYSYGEGKIFEDFSLSFSGGKKTALVGLSGS